MRRAAPLACAALLAALALTGTCTPREQPAAGERDAAGPQGGEAERPTPTGGPTLSAAEAERAREIVATMKHRPRCNRIMGCPGAVALAQHGEALVPFAIEVLEAHPRADGYWLFKLVELLGQTDDARALPWLHGRLADRRWELRIRAAQAIGNLARAESAAPLEAALAQVAGRDLAYEAALRYALSRVTRGPDAARHRAALQELVPTDRAGLARIPPVVLDVLVELVRQARLPGALPGVRLATQHDNRFVRDQALKTLAALQDTGGIPYALARLEDPLPSVARQALSALQAITGIRTMSQPQQWRRWAERHGYAEIPDVEPDGG